MPRRATSKKKLRPEQATALRKFQESFLSGSVVPQDELPTFEELGRQDSVTIIRQAFIPGSLPTMEPWIWNQSRGRAKQLLHGRYQVEFYKLRLEVHRRSTQRHAPRRKLWVFLCYDLEDDCQSTMLWCQEGHNGSECADPVEQMKCKREFGCCVHEDMSPSGASDDSTESDGLVPIYALVDLGISVA